MKQSILLFTCFLSLVIWLYILLNNFLDNRSKETSYLELSAVTKFEDITRLHSQLDELKAQSEESKKILLDVAETFKEFKQMSKKLESMQSQRGRLASSSQKDLEKLVSLERQIMELQKVQNRHGQKIKDSSKDADSAVDDFTNNFFIFVEELKCEDFGYESIYTTKLCTEAAQSLLSKDYASIIFSADLADIENPQGCSLTPQGLQVNAAGGGDCKQDGFLGCFCHRSRFGPALQFRGFSHYLHRKDTEPSIVFWHNIPTSNGFGFVDVEPVATLRASPALYEPHLDARLCLLMRQSARWDLWSAGPDTMPYPCTISGQQSFQIIEEKKLHMFSPQYELTRDPDIRLAYAANAIVNDNGNIYLEDTNEVLILDDCYWYPDQIRIKSLKHVSYDIYSLGTQKSELPVYKDVFVSSQCWGASTYHWMLETMPRLIPWIQFLKDNPKMKIHQTDGQKTIVQNFLKLIGVDPKRLIDGPTFATNLWTFRGTACGFSQVYPSQLMNQYFRDEIELEPAQKGIPVLLIRRKGGRQIPERIRESIIEYFQESDVGYDLMIYDGSHPLSDLAKMARKANIIIGGHGAGLSNMLWAEPGTYLVEIHILDGDLLHPNLCYYWSAMTMGMKYLGISYTRQGSSSVQEIFTLLTEEFSSADETTDNDAEYEY